MEAKIYVVDITVRQDNGKGGEIIHHMFFHSVVDPFPLLPSFLPPLFLH